MLCPIRGKFIIVNYNVNKILIPKEAGLSTYFTYLCRQKYLLTANIRIILKLEFSKK